MNQKLSVLAYLPPATTKKSLRLHFSQETKVLRKNYHHSSYSREGVVCEVLASTGPLLALCKGRVWPAHAKEEQKIRQKTLIVLCCLYSVVPTCSSVPRENRSVLLRFAWEKEKGMILSLHIAWLKPAQNSSWL